MMLAYLRRESRVLNNIRDEIDNMCRVKSLKKFSVRMGATTREDLALIDRVEAETRIRTMLVQMLLLCDALYDDIRNVNKCTNWLHRAFMHICMHGYSEEDINTFRVFFKGLLLDVTHFPSSALDFLARVNDEDASLASIYLKVEQILGEVVDGKYKNLCTMNIHVVNNMIKASSLPNAKSYGSWSYVMLNRDSEDVDKKRANYLNK